MGTGALSTPLIGRHEIEMKRFRKKIALLLSLLLCLSVLPIPAYADDDDVITITKRAPVDIVFVIDSTGSMGDEIGAVKDNIKSFLDQLYNYNRRISEASDVGLGIDPRIAIIDFKDATNNEETKFHKRDDGSYWFVKTEYIDDGDKLTKAINQIGLSGGGYIVGETPTVGLAMLYKADDEVEDVEGFEWRANAQKFVFLITDDFALGRNDASNIPDMSEVIEEFSKLNIRASVVTPSGALSNHYEPLYTGTGGKWYDLNNELKFMEDIIEYFEKELEIPAVNVSVYAAGAPEGIGSIKLLRYTDKDGAVHKGPSSYCGESPATVSVSLGSLVELEVDSNGTKNGVKDPEGNTYVIEKLTVNGEPQDLSGSEMSNYRIPSLRIRTDTTIQALLKKKDEPAIYAVVFDSNGGSPVSPQRVTEGEKISEPDDPERDDHTFNYWYLNDENTPFDFNTPVSSDLTLTASWNLIEKEEEEETVEPPAGLPSDWTKLRHVTPENAISTNYCVIARKQRLDVKPHIKGAVIYKSDNKKIASVRGKKGIVKGKRSGDAVITGYVRSGRKLIPTGTFTIHVVTPEINKKQYPGFNPDGFIDGNEHIVNEILSPTIWKSSDPSVATVSANSGMISVQNPKGNVKITAYYGLGRNAARYKFTLRIRPSSGAK